MSTTDTPTGQALAVTTPKEMVKQYGDSFAAVLPSHIVKPETWIRIAQGALKKGRLYNGGPQTELEVAAVNNPAVFLATLLDCARLGLEPGTEQYYLTPRKNRGKLEILGIVGYQGYIELMYRAGAVESVVAECVYANDTFRFRPGVDEIPFHEIDWDSDDRGELRLVYAFARMRGGAISKVVVMNKAAIAVIKAKAQDPNGQYSPWRTDPASMWLKSAVRQLRKWVPTSSEYITHRLRAERDGQANGELEPVRAPSIPDGPDLPPVDGLDDDIVDAEIIEDEPTVDEPDDDPTPPDDNGGGSDFPTPPVGNEGPGEGDAAGDPAAPSPAPAADDGDPGPTPPPDLEPEPVREPAVARQPAGINANDVARYARQVFKADYDAAPQGHKTKAVERLRHAVTFAQTGGRTCSLNDLDGTELVQVNERLRNIAGRALKYDVHDDAVVFTSQSGKETRIEWAQLETQPSASPSASAA